MKNELKLSLIIPAYNEEKCISACLESVLAQGPEVFFEIIVVNNKSTDRTSEIAGKFDGVKVINETWKGVTRARQRGYKESSGNIICFIDADNLIPKGWADRVKSEFLHNEKLVCLSGPYVFPNQSKFLQFFIKYVFWHGLAMPFYYLVGYMGIFGNMALRREVLDKMGGLDTSIEFYGDDTDTTRRASAYGKVKFSPSFNIYASNRRLLEQGLFSTTFVYIINFLSEVLLKKTVTKEYKDFR